MTILNSILGSLLNGGQVHDYAHASQIFRTSNYARTPKSKYLFQVNFILNSEAPSSISTREISYLVKSVDLPRFTFDVKDLNQYNRHTYIQDRIKYEPINIKFHDDNQNGLRNLWQDYYNYYYADGTYDLNTYNYDDRYQPRNISAWGLDFGSTTPFFSAIEIYSLNRGESDKITLMSPIITSFSHDTHDYSEGQGIMEATMQIRYNGVVYEDGYANGTPGFGSTGFYDQTVSGISGQFGGGYIDPNTGYIVQQPDSFTNRYATQQQGSFGFVDQGQSINQTANGTIPQIILNNTIKQNTGLEFPSNVPLPPIVTYNVPDGTTPGTTAVSNGESVSNSDQLGTTYTDGSIGQILFQRGYNGDQINAGLNFVNNLSADQLQTAATASGLQNISSTKTLLAQQYIDDPNNVSEFGTVNYGQIPPTPTITLGNPTNPPIPIFNNSTWQQNLLDQGYNSSDISLAETHINQLNYPPDTDLTSIAKSYISFSNSK